MSDDDKREGPNLRLVPGGRDRRLEGVLVTVAPAARPPFAVAAVAVEDDTFSVLAADPAVREPADHPIRTCPRTLLTPHLGYVTDGCYRNFYEQMVEDIEAWESGNPIRVLA